MIAWLFEKAPPALVAFVFIVFMAMVPLCVALIFCATGGPCE